MYIVATDTITTDAHEIYLESGHTQIVIEKAKQNGCTNELC